MADIDVKYLRDKNIAQLLESIAADLATQKPSDPEQYLRDRFAVADAGGITQGEAVKIHASQLDPCCALVLIAAAYARASVDYAEVDIEANKHLSTEFTAINPFQKVPVMEHKGLVVNDSGAIVRYLCNGKPALPLAARERAKIDAAFESIRASSLADATTAATEAVFAPRRSRRPADPVAVGTAVQAVKDSLRVVAERFFKESEWMLGRSITVADLALAAVAFTMAQTVGQDCFTDGPLKVWYDAMQKEAFFVESMRGFSAAAAQVRR